MWSSAVQKIELLTQKNRLKRRFFEEIWQITLIMIPLHPSLKAGVHFAGSWGASGRSRGAFSGVGCILTNWNLLNQSSIVLSRFCLHFTLYCRVYEAAPTSKAICISAISLVTSSRFLYHARNVF